MDKQIFKVEVRQSRKLLRQRHYVSLIWASNGQVAMTSEMYRAESDAVNLADKLLRELSPRHLHPTNGS